MFLTPTARSRLLASLACGGTFALWNWRGGLLPATLAGLAGCLALIAWVSPARYIPVQRALDRFVHLLLMSITWLLLGLVYFLVFTPMRCWRSLTKNDPLHRTPEPTGQSYLRPISSRPTRFDRQF